MKRMLCLVGLCVAIGCAPSDSGSPAPPADNTTSQIEVPAMMEVADGLGRATETKTACI